MHKGDFIDGARGAGAQGAGVQAVAVQGRGEAGHGLSVRDAVVGRRSVRGFKSDPVPDSIISQILADASRAPSGTNSQPWFAIVVTGEARQRLTGAVKEAAAAGAAQHEYPYFPDDPGEPYLSRRRKVGFDLYALYGIDRKDMEGRKRAAM